MAKMNLAQEISLKSDAGMKVASRVMELTHVKLGNAAWMEVVVTEMQRLDEFFWKYLHFEWNPDADPVGQLTSILHILNQLPDHHDMKVFQQIEKGN